MPTYRLTLAYDGANYVGWQRQAVGVSIQGLVEDALARLEQAPVTVVGAGRTDAGVHASGQVARASLTRQFDPDVVRRALNATLPRDVRVVTVAVAPATFHPRIDAKSKRYEYWWWEGEVQPPASRAWACHVSRVLDVAAMNRAASDLVGRHDVAAFQSAGSDVASTVRTILHASVRESARAASPAADLAARVSLASGRFIVFAIEADGFLRHMVRAIAGTLVEIGDGRRPADSMRALLDGRARDRAGATAPAHGLVLVEVRY